MQSVMDATIQRTLSVNGVPTSLADLGYTDVGLDDAWQRFNSGPGGVGYHDRDGRPIVNLTRFPSLKGLAAYAHARNLTAGCKCRRKPPLRTKNPAPKKQTLTRTLHPLNPTKTV